MRILSVVGARPNFMKIAPFARAIEVHNAAEPDRPIEHCLLHTGQHYDAAMSASFFDALGIPQPDIDLGIGSGSHAEQVGKTMMAFEAVLRERRPDWVIVVGDVNATCACSITAKKEHIQLAHIEAGLRSFDLDMPEEINRLVTDRLSDRLFVTDELAAGNLRAEGVPEDKIRFVGNVMIDTLDANAAKAKDLTIGDIINGAAIPPPDPSPLGAPSGSERDGEDSRAKAQRSPRGDGFAGGEYALMTLHRPSNVDDPAVLGSLVDFFTQTVCKDMPLVWTLHPRTRERLVSFGLWDQVVGCEGLWLVNPLGYHELLRLNMDARVFFTDSGGLQEECCVLGTPCVTLRFNTERPVTLVEYDGVSTLVGNDLTKISDTYHASLALARRPHRPPLWDGHTAERIVADLVAG
ncbi:MAG: UDP-N-acetyl glucosamine 2-epimerase [Verrucomicrobia bacterium]|nr:UDP-N-acetyl glucosamine 2-epimerase [Verrucomicrobiota bacterium]MBT7067690.1 UDP-N-acetyl glucosamine 2-epimerase [Verrucomicrobiota bacterium]MBT7702356.1 UDP-N-acetyl glucosamine 2-epimerase [Verrucomicrobiota bacterium]